MENFTQISVPAAKSGPFVVTGNFKLKLPNGETKECSGETVLCRCGKSKVCPFCDKTHEAISNPEICNTWF